MSTQMTTSEYLVLSRGPWEKDLSPENIKQIVNQFWAWFDRLGDEGKIKPGRKLAPEGKIVSNRKAVTDGPFGESKEVIGGYWFILAKSLEEAVETARGNPCLGYGATIEVRPVVVRQTS